MKALKTLGYVLALPALLILLWWVSTLGAVNFFVPTPAALVGKFGEVWFGPRFVTDVLPSVGRLLVGVVAAIVIGVGGRRAHRLGPLAAGPDSNRCWSSSARIPPPVLVPVLILLMGITDSMKIAVIVSGCVWPVLLNTIEGVRAVDGVLSDPRTPTASMGGPGSATWCCRRPVRRSWPACASRCPSG